MGTAHLHFLGGDRPDIFVEIELRPFGMPQLAGTNEQMRRQPKSGMRHPIAIESVDRAHQRAHFRGLGDRREVFRLRSG